MRNFEIKNSNDREQYKRGMETPDYYVETWLNGNKTHVLDTLRTCRANPDLHFEYISIMAYFETHSIGLCSKISLLLNECNN